MNTHGLERTNPAVAPSIRLLRERATWYAEGCEGLEDRERYFREDLADDAASDLAAALAILDAYAAALRGLEAHLRGCARNEEGENVELQIADKLAALLTAHGA